MATKSAEENFMDFNSPSKSDISKTNSLESPGSNPFDTLSQVADTFPKFDIVKDPFLCPENIDIHCGRESLGILHVDLNSIKFDDANWLNVPEIRVNNENMLQRSGENLLNEMNTAFLYSYNKSNKISTGSSVPSSTCSFPESLEFWELSKILSASSLINSPNIGSFSALNKAFVDTCNKSQLFLEMAKERQNSFGKVDLKCWRTRIHSLPDMLNEKDVDNNGKPKEVKLSSLLLRNFRKSESLFRRSFTLPQSFVDNVNEDNEFNDSVFIEAKHVASKMADDSILNLADAELYSLDCTPQPELVDANETIEEENIVSTEEVFKAVDKMIPSTSNLIATQEERSETFVEGKSPEANSDKSTDSASSLGRNECLQNLSEIFTGDNRKLSTSRLSQCSNNSKSRDAKSILHNLSEILSNDNPSARQKSEGQNLLFSLADMLCSNDHRDSLNECEQSEDSGHSSIDQDVLSTNKQENLSCNALDLRINTGTPLEDVKPLDLSISKKKQRNDTSDIGNIEASDSQSEVLVKKSLKLIGDNSVNKSKNESANSNDSKNSSNMKTNVSSLSSFGKFKPKRIDSKVVPEKGPLKAMIPVGNMAKPKGLNKPGRFSTTPTKSSHYTSGYKAKRTSTPKTDSKPQPVAQSTPEGNSNIKKGIPTPVQLRQRRFEVPVSPLARSNSIGNESAGEVNAKNRSGSAPNLSSSRNSKNPSALNDSSKIMLRRRSASDIKISKETNKFKRSNTIDKDSEIAKTISRVRQNIEKARSSSITNAKSTHNKLILGEKNRVSIASGIKPCNLVNKIRRNGKENICE